jgi:alcohol dehydrogenase
MKAFQFETVPSMLVEFSAARRLGSILRERISGNNICLITDSFLNKSQLILPAVESLTSSGFEVTVIDDVVADPPDTVVLAAAQRAREAGCEIVIGLGGGSSMDVAKLVAVLVPDTQPLSAMYGIRQVTGPKLPLILIPTTAGTGSEVTAISIVTTGNTSKTGIVSPHLFADLVILDAELTLGLPTAITAATGIDAIVHAIEAYTTLHLKNPVSDLLACQALRLLYPNLLPACYEGQLQSAREALLLGAMFAGQAFSNAPVAAVHALAYPLGGIYHLPHGLSNALVLPHVLRFNLPQAAHLYAELADELNLGLPGTQEARAVGLIDALTTLSSAAGLPQTLAEVGVPVSAVESLATEAMKQSRLLCNNPRTVTFEDAISIYTQALGV